MVSKSASNNTQSDHENRVVSQFTQLLEIVPKQLTKTDPPAADFLIKDAPLDTVTLNWPNTESKEHTTTRTSET